MSDPKHPEVGDLIVDASDVQTKRLEAGISKIQKLHNGYEGAMNSLQRATPAMLARAGVSPEALARIIAANSNLSAAQDLLPAAEALVGTLKETIAAEGHELDGLLSECAVVARLRAEHSARGQEILAALGDLIDYHFGPAAKALATRLAKAAARKEGEAVAAE